MILPSFKRNHIVDYLTGWEKRTLDNLGNMTSADPDNAIRQSTYGKNSPRTPPGVCDRVTKSGSWSLTSDGALLALTDMARRWNHEPVLQYLARIYTYALDICPWWHQTFRVFPGEYGKLEPCWSKADIKKSGDSGDTDFWRHYGSLGLLRLGIDPAVSLYGDWYESDILALTDLHFSFVSGNIASLGQGEFLRMSYRAEMLLGCYDVYKSVGQHAKADQCWNMITTFWRWYLPSAIWESPIDQDGNKRPLFTYGPMVLDSRMNEYVDPWRYGWYPGGGGQSWYYGHVGQALIQCAFRALKRGDNIFFQHVTDWLMKISVWCDPRLRETAPLVPLTGPNDPEKMCNVLIHGGKRGTSPHGYATDIAYAGTSSMLSLDEYESHSAHDHFIRHLYADKYLNIDGGVWDTVYTDPLGNKHPRKKWSNGTYTPKMTSLDAVNANGLLSVLWSRALINQDQDLTRWFEIWLAESCAFANSTNQKVRLMRAIPGLGEEGLSLIHAPGRLWSWTIKAGWEGRAMMVGSQSNDKGLLDEMMGFAGKVTGGMDV